MVMGIEDDASHVEDTRPDGAWLIYAFDTTLRCHIVRIL